MNKNFKNGFEKTAFLGLAIDLGLVGMPSALGYYIGKNSALSSPKDEVLASEPGMLSRFLGYNFLPGYTGYRFGLDAGMAAKNDVEEKREKKEKYLSTLLPGGVDPDDRLINKLQKNFPSKDL